MKTKYFLPAAIFILICLGCSSTRLIDSWQSDRFSTLRDKRILVIHITNDPNVRESYEIDIATKLRRQGIDAVELHIKFPALKEPHTPEEKNKAAQIFKNGGIEGFIMTYLKDTIETQNANSSIQAEIPQANNNKSSFGSNTKQMNSSSLISKTYVLEALTYNLSLEKDKQLVNVSLVDVTDPKSRAILQKTFTKLVAAQFK